jgi:hypothetical protein
MDNALATEFADHILNMSSIVSTNQRFTLSKTRFRSPDIDSETHRSMIIDLLSNNRITPDALQIEYINYPYESPVLFRALAEWKISHYAQSPGL